MAQIEYDESGATFSYFLLSAFAFLLIPLTYVLWPRRTAKQDDEVAVKACRCEGCVRKLHKKDTKKPREQLWRRVRYIAIAIGWTLFAVMFYRTFTMELEAVEYDPYEILEISRGADMAEIRRQYRQLSLRYHPDKDTGNQDKFMKIAKAYEALTDEESRKNWEEYGNPDGPRATSFGIALPSWIVSQESSIWVLVVYVGVFMVALPTAVGVWWYRSIKYSTANVLLDTQKLFFYCLNRKGAVDVKTLLMILTSAFEFSSRHGSKIKERPSDDEELSKIITTSLPYCNMKVQQPPYSYPHSRKCRALMHAYLSHVPLPGPLHEDLLKILNISPMLLQELLSVLKELAIFALIYPKRGVIMPSVDTFENVMRLSAMIVQCLWENQSPLLQLPHLSAEQLKHFHTKKRHINSVEDFAALSKEQKRKLLKTLTDTEYNNVLAVLSSYPQLSVTVDVKVLDDEEENRITVGSLITVEVEITRTPLMEYKDDDDDVAEEEDVVANEVETIPTPPVEQENEDKKVTKVTKAWEKQKRKKKGVAKATPKGKTKKKPQAKQSQQKKESESEHSEKEDTPPVTHSNTGDHSNHIRQRVTNVKPSSSPSSAAVQEKQSKRVTEEESNSEHGEDEDDEEKEWNELQKEMKQKKLAKVNYQSNSWPVHAPFFPEEKQEVWWVYVCDRRRKTMIAYPDRVAGLRETEKTQLQFQAPPKPGIYNFSVVVKSDSYLECIKECPLKLKVDEAKEIVTDQWKDLEEAEAEEEAFEDSDQDGEMSDSDDSTSEE